MYFYRAPENAVHAERDIVILILAVRPSVRPSVQRRRYCVYPVSQNK